MTDSTSDDIPRGIATELEGQDEDTLRAVAEYAENLTASEESDTDGAASEESDTDGAAETTTGGRRSRNAETESTVPDDVPAWCFHF